MKVKEKDMSNKQNCERTETSGTVQEELSPPTPFSPPITPKNFCIKYKKQLPEDSKN